ncbi:MAG TPA: outer membrane beta-barrel protein, partial [Holophaga sp.]|nr:outer membrane beta-barrel protein [Holophaga sp.]
MKLTACVLLLAATAAGLQAQEGSKWITAQAAYIVPSYNLVTDGPGYGGSMGMWLTDKWGVEGSALRSTMTAKNVLVPYSGRETQAFLSGLYCWDTSYEKVRPFLRLGAGVVRTTPPWSQDPKSVNTFSGVAGVGLQYRLAPHVLATLEGRGVKLASSTKRSEFQTLLGLGYRWGGATKAAAPVPTVPLQAPEPAPVPAPVVEKPAP